MIRNVPERSDQRTTHSSAQRLGAGPQEEGDGECEKDRGIMVDMASLNT